MQTKAHETLDDIFAIFDQGVIAGARGDVTSAQEMSEAQGQAVTQFALELLTDIMGEEKAKEYVKQIHTERVARGDWREQMAKKLDRLQAEGKLGQERHPSERPDPSAN